MRSLWSAKSSIGAAWVLLGFPPLLHYGRTFWRIAFYEPGEPFWSSGYMLALWVAVMVAGGGVGFGKRWGRIAMMLLLPVVGFHAACWSLMCLFKPAGNVDLAVFSVVVLAFAAVTWIWCLFGRRQREPAHDRE